MIEIKYCPPPSTKCLILVLGSPKFIHCSLFQSPALSPVLLVTILTKPSGETGVAKELRLIFISFIGFFIPVLYLPFEYFLYFLARLVLLLFLKYITFLLAL